MTEGSLPPEPRASALSRLLAEIARVEDADLPDRFVPGLAAGAQLGRFVIEREIGRGGFGVVYAAQDPDLGRPVALKLLKPGSRVAARGEEWVRREAEAVARLNDPRIVTLHDFGRAEEGAYLVFELLRGETLAEREARGKVPLDEVLRIATAIAAALVHAHGAGVLHRDLKPANVFLCAGGAVKVLDFGVAHLFGRGAEASGGTPAYMAPEQRADGAVDARADLYALGVVLYELLAGALPPEGVDGACADLPPLPRAAGPAQLRRLVASLTAADPAARPASAALVAEALGRIARARAGRGRRLAGAALSALALIAVAVAGWALLFGREAAPGERLTAVLADADNQTGDPDLDRMGDVLRGLLGESRRLEPLSRDRLAVVARQAGLPPRVRLDAAAARELARLAGAGVLLLPSARREGEQIRLALSAVAPDDGRTLFTLAEEASGKGGLPATLDRLMAGARSRLRERREDLRSSPIQLARMASADLTAYRHYLDGLDCMARPSAGPANTALARCGPHFSQAIALDPGFPLAHYQLAFLLAQEGAAPAELRAHMEAALAGADRLSRRDAALVRAWQAHLDRRDDEALRTYDQLIEASPDDREVLYLAGDLRFHRSDWPGAIPFFQKVLALDPDAEWPLEHLMECYAVTDRHRELAAMATELRNSPVTPERTRVLIRALAWLGQHEEAIEVARRAVAEKASLSAAADLCSALLAAGRFEEAEALLRRRADLTASTRGAIALSAILVTQGRRRLAWQTIDEMPSLGGSPNELRFERAVLAAGEREGALLASEGEKLSQVGDAEYLASIVVLMALRGDPAQARRLSAALPAIASVQEEVSALLEWRAGNTVAAAATLTAVESRDPWPTEAIAPSYLLAEVSASQGDWREVVAAARRYQLLWPRGLARGWIWPRTLYLSALAHARLGERDAAQAGLDRLTALLHRADPDLLLLRDTRQLRRTIRHER